MTLTVAGARIMLALALGWHAAVAGAVSWAQTEQRVLPARDAGAVEADYRFTNGGDQALGITVTTTCNCTEATADQQSYAPGEHGCVHVILRLGDGSGPLQKGILVTFSDGETKQLLLRTEAPAIFVVSERFLHWRCGAPCEPHRVRVDVAPPCTVHSLCARQARIVDIQASVLVPGHSFLVTVTPKSTAKPDLDYLTIDTDHPNRERSEIKLFVDITPEPEPASAADATARSANPGAAAPSAAR
jgi:hypothetical protein